MNVLCAVYVNTLDPSHKVYLIPGMNSKFVDNVEFLPVFEDPIHPKLQWIRKDAYTKIGAKEVEVNG